MMCPVCSYENHPNNMNRCNRCGSTFKRPDHRQILMDAFRSCGVTNLSVSMTDGNTGYMVLYNNNGSNLVGMLERLHKQYGLFIYAINNHSIEQAMTTVQHVIFLTTDEVRRPRASV